MDETTHFLSSGLTQSFGGSSLSLPLESGRDLERD